MCTVSEQYKLEQKNIRLKEKADMYDQVNINQLSMIDDLDENKETNEEYLKLYGNLVRLQMGVDPKFAEDFKKLVSKQKDVPEELKKKFSAI